MSVLTLESSALVLDLTQLCCCITQTHHRCPSAGLCESSQDDAYRKEKPAWWCLLLAATSLRWTTKSLCSLTCHLYREDSFACLSKTTVKSGFMLYAKVNFFPTSMFMKANKQSNIHPGSNPLILSHSPDVRGTTTRQVLLCPQGHVCHCAHEGTQGKGCRDSRLFLCGWDMLPMHLWAGGDCLALHLPTAQTAHLWSFSIYMGISHARPSMLQRWWCNPAMSLVTQCLLEQDGKV